MYHLKHSKVIKDTDLMNYHFTNDIFSDVKTIIETAQRNAYHAADRILVLRNWLLGKRISEEILTGTRSERYGNKIIDELSGNLTSRFGSGFDRRSLYRYVQFFIHDLNSYSARLRFYSMYQKTCGWRQQDRTIIIRMYSSQTYAARMYMGLRYPT